MARSLLGEVILRLIDQASGPARNVAGALREAEGATRALANAGKGFDGWGRGFQRSLDNFKLSARDLSQIQGSFERLKSTMQNIAPSDASARINAWKGSILSSLTQIQGQAQRTQAALQSISSLPQRTLMSGARFALGAAGVGGAAVGANRLVRMANTVGGEQISNDTRARLGGLAPEQIAAINQRAFALSRQYPALTTANMQESLRDLGQSMGGRFGGVDKALQVADSVAQMATLLGSLYGQDRATTSMRGGFRALDNLNRNIDPERFRAILQGWTRAALVEGPEFDIGRMFTFAKYSKSAGGALSDRFLYETLPALVNDMGESRVGTALATSMSSVIGNQASAERLREQQRLGLRSGFRSKREPGQFGNAAMFSENPDQYAWNVLKPALQRAGVDVSNDTAVSQALNKMFPQMVADLYSKLINQEEQYRRKQRQNQAAAGFSEAQMLAEQDWRVGLQAVIAQFKNAIAEVSQPIMQSLLPAMRSLWTSFGEWASWAKSNPEQVKAAFQNLVGTVGSLAIALAGLKIASVVALGAAGPALNLSALSLRGAAGALTAAAGRIGLASVPAALAPAAAAAAGGTAAGATAGGVAGALARGAMRFIPGVGWVMAGAAAGYGAGKAVDELSGIASGRYWTPANSEEIEGYKARIAELQERLAGIDSRTHPAMRGQPNAERANIEEQLRDLQNRVSAGEARQQAMSPGGTLGPESGHEAGRLIGDIGAQGRAEGERAGAEVGQGVAQGIQNSAPAAEAQATSLMGRLRALFSGGVDVPVRVQPTAGAPAASPPGRASGGPVSAGHLYQINEAGQELFMPGANGSIIPNHALGGLGGGRSVRFNAPLVGTIQVTGGNTQEIMDKIGAELRDAMAGAFNDSEENWG